MMVRSEGWWSDEVERLIDARKVACRKFWDDYKSVRKVGKRKIRKEKKEL